MHVSSTKDCYCHTCKKDFHYLGITRHRAAHRDRQEDCEITFTHGNTRRYLYSQTRSGKTKVADASDNFMSRRLVEYVGKPVFGIKEFKPGAVIKFNKSTV